MSAVKVEGGHMSVEEALCHANVESVRSGNTWVYCRMNLRSLLALSMALGSQKKYSVDGGIELHAFSQVMHVAPDVRQPEKRAELVNARGEVVVDIVLSM